MIQSNEPGDVRALQPGRVWEIFAGIAAVPRPSKKEEKIRAHVRGLAEAAGLTVREDATGNLVVSVPASAGCEGAPVTVLQSHLDMVCERNRDVQHDFDNEGIGLVVASDPKDGRTIVRAKGTTLGADNGIGVSMALAAATDPELKHGPLELLFTVDEEAGMSGAKALTSESFTGRRMLNLDSEEDDALYIGCAGGCDTTLSWTLPMTPVTGPEEVCQITVTGLRGGHSGSDIHENRGNANKWLVWVLRRAGTTGVRIASFDGGSKRNAIAREAHAVVVGPRGFGDTLVSSAQEAREAVARQCGEADAKIELKAGSAEAALSAEDTAEVLDAIDALPHGVLGMSTSVPGLVQTSTNVATVNIAAESTGAVAKIGNLSRSSSQDWMRSTLDEIGAIGRLAGAEVEHGNEYPGWEPNPDSPLLATCAAVYERTYGQKPRVEAIHAGLECGIIGERVGQMDMVSLGPLILGAHSPDERVYVESVQKSWAYLRAILEELAKG